MSIEVQAGVLQAGSVALFVAALPLAVTTVLIARVGRASNAVPGWIAGTGWLVFACLLLGITVALLVPFGAWAIALGLKWGPRGATSR